MLGNELYIKEVIIHKDILFISYKRTLTMIIIKNNKGSNTKAVNLFNIIFCIRAEIVILKNQ